MEIETAFFMAPSLRGRENEDDTLKAIADVGPPVADTVIVGYWYHREQENALGHPYSKRLLTEINNNGLGIILGTEVFPRRNEQLMDRRDVFSAARYAAVLADLRAKADLIGAKRTWAYTEPHADSPHASKEKGDRGFKRRGFTDYEYMLVTEAVRQGVQEAGPATYVDPGAHHQGHWCWAFRGLGEKATHRDTFRMPDPHNYTPYFPPGYPTDLEVVHFHVTMNPSKWTPYTGGALPLTIDEYKGIDWDKLLAVHPGVKTRVVFAQDYEKADVWKALAA